MAQHADYRDASGQLIDDVVYTYFAGPKSYTGEDLLEISCHGNPFIAQKILEDLYARGCRPAEPGEFTKRAYLNGRIDLSQAEAVIDLIRARSERALAAANAQLRGALGREIESLSALLINILASIEAYIDFPEDDLPPEDLRRMQQDLSALLERTQRLIATNHYGAMLRDGIRTIILGQPNAGKSSLLNRLIGHDRALVGPDPGTTRDYLEEPITIGQHSLRLIDTAGLNPHASPLEHRGIAKTLEQSAAADLYLWVVDSTLPFPDVPLAIQSRLTCANTVIVFNKIDLLPEAASGRLVSKDGFPFVCLSALDGRGVDKLREAITGLVSAHQSSIDSEFIAINARHTNSLITASACLRNAQVELTNNSYKELLASELMLALSAYAEISGESQDTAVLDRLFSAFCIGK
jgi:tRNA modification GTPase